jgi:subtilase family serine protease
MKSVRLWSAIASAGLAASVLTFAGGAPSANAAASGSRTPINGTATPASERTHPQGAVAASNPVSFDLVLALRDAKGAAAFAQQVSTPGSSQYHQFLTEAQWVSRFGPSPSEVAAGESWLRSAGFSVGAVPTDRLILPAVGTAAQIEKAFGSTLGYYKVNGHNVRLANGTLSVPSSIAGVVSGVTGVNQYVATPDLAEVPAATAAAAPNQEPPPPAAFRNPQPCSAFWGQKTDTADAPSLYHPYTAPQNYDICGYTPAQLRGAYGIDPSATNGKGVTIAIVDAYDSPTLLSDAQKYATMNDPSHPLSSSQFTNLAPATVDDQAECAASGWFDEQALDVESSHGMAPKAHILFVGAQDCLDSSLLAALQTAVTSGASVVSDSWGDVAGDLLTDASTHTAFDNTFMLADSTGVSVLFSSGDDGDNFAVTGMDVPDFPPTSPFVTAVGGTTLEVGSADQRVAENGWSTAKQVLCGSATKTCSGTAPAGSLNWQAGGGGGTSYFYTQPSYQANVVPAALALRNQNIFGPVPLRVEPDIALDGDAQSGMLIGLTETFPSGVKYGQFKEGGTSLASPLLAGIVADTDQAAGSSLGFLNPILYHVEQKTPAAFNDILPPAHPLATSVIRVDFANTVNANSGYAVSLRAIDYQGPETYCDATGNCATRNVTLSPATGFDSLTGIGSIGPRFITALSKF